MLYVVVRHAAKKVDPAIWLRTRDSRVVETSPQLEEFLGRDVQFFAAWIEKIGQEMRIYEDHRYRWLCNPEQEVPDNGTRVILQPRRTTRADHLSGA